MSGPSDIAAVVGAYHPDGDEISVGVARDALGSGRPMWPRDEFDPGHFTASGFVASPDGTSLLLIHHAKLGRWLQPGGHFESGDESIEAAARREVAEETGLTDIDRVGLGLVRIDAHPIPARANEPGHVHIDLAMGFIAGTVDIAVVDEILDARWVPWGQLADFGVDDAIRCGAASLRMLLGRPGPTMH